MRTLMPYPAHPPRRARPAHPTLLARASAITTAVGALLLVPIAAASAHVPVTPATTSAGSFTELTFRVPAESETASTTALTVHLPQSSPFTTVAVESEPGWTAQVSTAALAHPVKIGGATITKAPSSVTWTATGSGIAPEQYTTFTLTVGPLPKKGTTVTMPATQSYSDGSVVHWDQKTPASGKEPENPAPHFVTTAHTGAGDDDDAPATGQTPTTAAPEVTSDHTARWLGGGGLVLGAAALVASLARRRRPRGVTP